MVLHKNNNVVNVFCITFIIENSFLSIYNNFSRFIVFNYNIF
jgi:hypothetical protein